MLNESVGANNGLNRSLDMIRANPLPFALIGIGAAWLIASNTSIGARIGSQIGRDERLETVRRRAADLVAGVASDIGTRTAELASDITGRVKRGAAELPLGHTGNPMVDDAGRTGSNGWVHQAADMAQEALRTARDSGGVMLNRAERHPLAIGAIGIMTGAALALLLPATRTEDAVLGDALWQKAQEAGQQAVARVREVGARAAARAAQATGGTDKPSQG